MASDSHIDQEPSTLLPVADDPLCREASLASLDSWITPTERFYIRNHFSHVPELDLSSWRLEVDGQVNQPLTLTLDDITRLPARELVVTMECAGNSRSYVTPPAEGLAFRHGAVSTGRWKGVSLKAVLEMAGIQETANGVICEGADRGEEQEDGVSFELSYRRSLSLAKALDEDILLAYEMNGEPISTHHGFPLRLIVPSWYGMASVKWLTRINLTDQPFDGFFQQRRYVMINEGAEDSLEREPVAQVKVKSLIASPRHGEVIQDPTCTIRGFAWTGEGQVDKVEVSADDGQTWAEATLLADPTQHAWREWEMVWQVPSSGHYLLMARATDSAGNTQPSSIAWNFRGYANNSIHTIAVEAPARKPIPS